MDRAEVAEPLVAEQTWRLLWSHAAYQVIAALPCAAAYERITVGAGWGLRSRADRRRALLLHPSGRGREVGELSLTIPGAGTQPIPRCGRGYIEYLDAVADSVATSARAYLDGTA